MFCRVSTSFDQRIQLEGRAPPLRGGSSHVCHVSVRRFKGALAGRRELGLATCRRAHHDRRTTVARVARAARRPEVRNPRSWALFFVFVLFLFSQGMRNGMTLANHPTGGFLEGNPQIHPTFPTEHLQICFFSDHVFVGEIGHLSWPGCNSWRGLSFF